jgi:hypothetical protein
MAFTAKAVDRRRVIIANLDLLSVVSHTGTQVRLWMDKGIRLNIVIERCRATHITAATPDVEWQLEPKPTESDVRDQNATIKV